MDTEINDLLDEHEIVTFTDIANQLQVHVNKAKSLIKSFAKASSHETIYYLSGVQSGKIVITLARGNEQRRELCDKFDKIFSHHVYAIVKKDFDIKKRELENPVPQEFGIRDIPEKVKGVKAERIVNEPNVDIFKKKAPPAKPIAKAFAKTTKKELAESKKDESKTKTNFFAKKSTPPASKKTKPKTEPKKVKKEATPPPEENNDEDEDMEVDEKPKSPKIERKKSPKAERKSPRVGKTKRRRIQIESSSSEEDDTEAQKLLFGESNRVRNLSLEDDEPAVLAENTVIQSSSEEEDDSRNDEKENEPEKREKKKKTSFGSAKVIESGQLTRKVKKKKYTVDDEGNMVTETYFSEEEITKEEMEKEKAKEEKKKAEVKKLAPPPTKKSAPAVKANKGPMKQKSISAFFKKK